MLAIFVHSYDSRLATWTKAVRSGTEAIQWTSLFHTYSMDTRSNSCLLFVWKTYNTQSKRLCSQRPLLVHTNGTMLSAITPLLLFIAWLLLLLVSVSVPITKTIYLFNLIANISSGILRSSATASAKFGVWGYCYSGVDVSGMFLPEYTQFANCDWHNLSSFFFC